MSPYNKINWGAILLIILIVVGFVVMAWMHAIENGAYHI